MEKESHLDTSRRIVSSGGTKVTKEILRLWASLEQTPLKHGCALRKVNTQGCVLVEKKFSLAESGHEDLKRGSRKRNPGKMEKKNLLGQRKKTREKMQVEQLAL